MLFTELLVLSVREEKTEKKSVLAKFYACYEINLIHLLLNPVHFVKLLVQFWKITNFIKYFC